MGTSEAAYWFLETPGLRKTSARVLSEDQALRTGGLRLDRSYERREKRGEREVCDREPKPRPGVPRSVSSSVMPSSSTANSDLACQRSMYSLSVSGDQAKLGSMNMDDLLRNIYGDGTAAAALLETPFGGGSREVAARPPLSGEGSFSLPRSIGSKTVEEVWREISQGRKAGGRGGGSGYKDASGAAAEAEYGKMTLEDFLARAGAVMEEDARVPPGSAAPGGSE